MGYVRRTASSFTQFVVVEIVKITRHTTGSVTNKVIIQYCIKKAVNM